MKREIQALVAAALLALPSTAGAVERVEIVLDASSAMWKNPGGGQPFFVAVREALLDYAAGAAERQGRPEVALRVVGGLRDRADGEWCEDTHLAIDFDLIEPAACAGALSGIVPRGGRPLVRALEAAVEDLADAPARRRIVIISAGTDECGGDIIEALQGISSESASTAVRIIGLGLDRETANAATTLAPTRNLFDLSLLPDTLKWALQPADTRPPVAARINLVMTVGGAAPESAEIDLTGPRGTEAVHAKVENGRSDLRLVPGRYRGKVRIGEGPTMTFSGLVIGASGRVELDLLDLPPVTLEVPDTPVAGGPVGVAYWGAPQSNALAVLALPGSPSDVFLVRTPIAGGDGEAVLGLPDAFHELETWVMAELRPGLYQELGRLAFESSRPRAALEAPDSVENGTELTISWTGPGHEHDYITLTPRGAPDANHLVCVPAGRAEGTASLAAPAATGIYDLFYHSASGHIIERHTIEVYEILATLDGPAEAAPGKAVQFTWTGPDAELDYICISPAGSEDDRYLDWTPSASGNPARLRTPDEPGGYEVRYIRSADGAVLARHPISIEAEEIQLRAPRSVPAGTRFKVRWSGSSGHRDFIAVAPAGSTARETLDFAFASSGSPVSLAAPFEPGTYEIRYISGGDLEVLAVVPLDVRSSP